MTAKEYEEEYDRLCIEINKAWSRLNILELIHLSYLKQDVLNKWEKAFEEETNPKNPS